MFCLASFCAQRYWTLLVFIQNICKHKNLLGNQQWKAVDSKKHCEKRLPLKYHSFQDRSNFPRFWFWDLIIRFSRSQNQASVSTQLSVTRVWFFFHCYLTTHMFDILCICWDTTSEKTGLWQLPKVSSAFKWIYEIRSDFWSISKKWCF